MWELQPEGPAAVSSGSLTRARRRAAAAAVRRSESSSLGIFASPQTQAGTFKTLILTLGPANMPPVPTLRSGFDLSPILTPAPQPCLNPFLINYLPHSLCHVVSRPATCNVVPQHRQVIGTCKVFRVQYLPILLFFVTLNCKLSKATSTDYIVRPFVRYTQH